tara:strand:+ start:5099 stop:6043 length:945 start_codon:yes stop_codon:yes gene_type:complete
MLILHLGFPKCASTSLQEYFSHFNGFIGCNVREKVGSFYREKLTTFFEGHLRFSPDRVFQEHLNKCSEKINNLCIHSATPTIYSNENVLCRMIPSDLPASLKLERHKHIFKNPDYILINHRKPSSFFNSQYRLFVTNGYTGTFSDFCQEMELINPFGYHEYLDLTQLKEDIKKIFPNSKTIFVDIAQKNSINHAMKILGLVYKEGFVGRHNIGIKIEDINKHLELNKRQLPRKLYNDWIEIHRLTPESNISDSYKFHLSRTRHMHEDLISDLSNSISQKINTNLELPSFIEKLDESYFNFLDQNKADCEGVRLI